MLTADFLQPKMQHSLETP